MMRKIHYLSGLVITTFVGIHLLNHLCGIISPEKHIEVMNALRPFYRNVVIETLLLFAVLLQIFSGLKLFFSRQNKVSSRFERLHIWTGLYLAIFFIFHIGAVLIGRFILHLDTNFYFGVAGVNTFPFNLFFVPYYALALLSFFGHIAAIHNQKSKKRILGLLPNQQANVILLIGILMTVSIFYALTNGFNGVEIPDEFGIMIGK
jgi:hypothetical protein